MGVIKRTLNAGLARLNLQARLNRSAGVFGLELRRTTNTKPAPDLSPLFDDPYEALCYLQGGGNASFHLPLDKCVTVNGLNFSENGWHPFAAASAEYLQGTATSYEGSVLERYYQRWQPANAAEALIYTDSAPAALRNSHPCLMCLAPWSALTEEQVIARVHSWGHNDYVSHGLDDYNIEEFGFKHHGPVDSRLGQFEWQRLVSTVESVKQQGFRRELGEIWVSLIKRGSDVRFVNNGGGLHRTATMRALGKPTVPAKFKNAWIVDVKDVGKWPQVRRGTWSTEEAKRYVDHLFDFDARNWARELGLLRTFAA